MSLLILFTGTYRPAPTARAIHDGGGGGFFTDTRDYPRAEETRDDVMKKLMKEDREMFDLIQIIVATGVMD